MSSIYAESLSRALESEDNDAAVNLLESRISAGSATEGERLLCGVLLLLPPFGDYEAAADIFRGLLGGRRCLDAAVWDAYRFSVLLPDGDRTFEKVLGAFGGSAVAAHMRSKVARACNDVSRSLEEGRRSRELRLFPFNIADGLKHEVALTPQEKIGLWRTLSDLVVSRAAESDSPVSTVEGALQRRWDNLILGTRLSSQVWSEYRSMFGTL